MQKDNIITITSTDSFYPRIFSQKPISCTSFYAAGNYELLSDKRPKIAIVGSRNPTPYGVKVTRQLASDASLSGAIILSGLALGIDGVAHKAAIDAGGQSISVLPGSIERIYPASHENLAQQILTKNGLLITEYTGQERPYPYNFIRRNRLIAALADIVVVTEATSSSGTSHTINAAISLGKTIAAVPGSIYSPQSDGTNMMIRDGGSDIQVITSSDDLLMLAKLNENSIKFNYHPKNHIERAILKPLKIQNYSSETLLKETRLKINEFNSHLTILEMRQAIERAPDGSWRLKK